jgi:hypothetical protein
MLFKFFEMRFFSLSLGKSLNGLLVGSSSLTGQIIQISTHLISDATLLE